MSLIFTITDSHFMKSASNNLKILPPRRVTNIVYISNACFLASHNLLSLMCDCRVSAAK